MSDGDFAEMDDEDDDIYEVKPVRSKSLSSEDAQVIEKTKRKQSLPTHSRPCPVVTSGKLKRRKSMPKNIFTTSFTKNVKSNNATLAKQVAKLREQLHQVSIENRALTHASIEERIQFNTEKAFLGEHVARFGEHIQQCVKQVGGFVEQLGQMDRELQVMKEYCKETQGSARHYRDDNFRDEYNRVSSGSKTQTVNPMVSGLTITQPTISLSRVDNPATARPSSAAPTMTRISEENTSRASAVGPADRALDDSDEEVNNSMLSRSHRVWTDPRAASRNPPETETQAAFYRRVYSEDPLEGTSRSRPKHRRMPHRVVRPAAEPVVNNVHDRTSLDAVDMDETDISDLSPILRCPAVTLPVTSPTVVTSPPIVTSPAAMTLTLPATLTSQCNALPSCSVNMSVGNALDNAKPSTSRVGKCDASTPDEADNVPVVDVVANAASLTPIVLSAVDRLRLTVARDMSRSGVSLVPCTVQLTATDALNSTSPPTSRGTAVAPGNEGLPRLSSSSTCPLVARRKKGRHSVVSSGKTVSGSVRTPNVAETNTTPNVSVNLVKLHSSEIDTVTRSVNVASATAPSQMPSDKPLETRVDNSSEENSSASAPARTKTSAPAPNKLPEKPPGSARSSSHQPETDPRSVKKPLKTETSATPQRPRPVQARHASKSAIENNHQRSVTVQEASRSAPVKKTTSQQAKKAAAAAARVEVENDVDVLYEETPTYTAKRGRPVNIGRGIKQLKAEPMSEADDNNDEAAERRALRRVGPTNYKEPSLTKKMRRERNCETS